MREFIKDIVCRPKVIISFTNPKLAGLYNTRSLNCDISDVTYHEIHTNLPLLLNNIACSCQAILAGL